MNQNSVRIFVLILSSILFSSCSAYRSYVELSDHFALKSTKIYTRDNVSSPYKLIGAIESSNWNKPFSGAALRSLKLSVLAISFDGRSLLYRHRNTFFGIKKEEGVYWYRVGKPEKLLYSESILTRFWSRYERPIPKNIMVLESDLWPTEDEWALNADDGVLQPLSLYGSTPLHMATYKNNFEQVLSLLDKGADLDSKTYWGLSPLEIAVKKGYDKIAILLIERGADYNTKTRYYLSAIQLAVHLQRWNVIEAIHQIGGKLNAPGLLRYSFMLRWSSIMSDDVSGHKNEDIIKMIEMILLDGADPNVMEPDIIYRLLTDSGKMEAKDRLATLKLLLKYGADASAIDSSTQSTPLDGISSRYEWNQEEREIVTLLVSNMRSLEVKNKWGYTPLQSGFSNINNSLFLIDLGADDTVEYICGQGWHMGISIRQVIEKWKREPPQDNSCAGGKQTDYSQ